ncbi:CBS domain-containing protein [Candidatus Woesearchaeota archaeon]|nr:CBS domain-containing protein [Candidatus Woesearchaeota archaeon]
MTDAKDILRKEYLTANKEETLTRVNSRIKYEAFSEVLVFDMDKLSGIYAPSRASTIPPTKENMDQIRIEKLVRSINPLDENSGLNEMMVKMLATGYNMIPISKNGKVTGIVHIFDLLDAIKPQFEGLKVSDIELQKPVELLENEEIGKAIHLLHKNINETILIKDKNQNSVGILNHYDLLRNLKLDLYKEDRQKSEGYKSERKDMFDLPISKFVRSMDFVSVDSKDSLMEVIKLFKENNVTSLIVEDVSSIIRSVDILKSQKKSNKAKMNAVDYVGLEELNMDDFTVVSIKTIIQQSFEKIVSIFQQDATLKVHIKRHIAGHENKRHTYSVVLHLEYAGNYFSIENINDWDLIKAVKLATKQLGNRVNRVFKTKGAESRNSAKSLSEERNQEDFFAHSSN